MIKSNLDRVRNVLLIILIANIVVAVCKIVVGSFIKSASMSADGFHSLSDGASNVVGFVGIWFASKPVDSDHPYGHSKFETLASLFIGCMLILVGFNITISAFERFFRPTSLNITLDSILTLVITLCINIFVSWFEYKEGTKLSSQILVADSLHTRSDIFVSIGVLITLISIKLGLPEIVDPIASMVVASFIFYASYEILKETGGVLVDRAVVDTERIQKIVSEFSEVKNVHHIRSRGKQDEIYIDLHVMIDPNMNVRQSHALVHDIETRMKQELCENVQTIVHLEPYYNTSDNIGDVI